MSLRVMPVVAAVLCACGAQINASRVNRSALEPAQAAKHQDLVKAGDELWRERLDEGKLRQAIAAWQDAVAVKPADHETFQKLSRACYFLADGFLAFDSEKTEEFLATHDRGVSFAENGLRALSPE